MRILLCCVLMCLATSPAVAEQSYEFKPLFNGKDVDGWVKRGGKAEYRVENGEVVGVSQVNTENTFLCTPRDYANFILELDVKVDPRLNSGVQIRSHAKDKVQEFDTKDGEGKPKHVRIPANRVHGYQVEIDPSDRAWSGGIYDEARRDWLNKLEGDKHKAARAAFKNGEWNHYRIVCQGPSIKTWINGVPCADLHDDMTPSGFIALQVHSVGSDEKLAGKEVRWRNIRIAELK